jgi:hypothetical protein
MRSSTLDLSSTRLDPASKRYDPHDPNAGTRSPQRFLSESLGPGCAFLDYDNDGRVDLLLAKVERLTKVAIDRYVEIVEGRGIRA